MNAHARLIARLDAEKAKHRLRSDAALARHIGMSPGWISALRDEGVGRNLSRLDAIAERLGVDVADLLRAPSVADPNTSQIIEPLTLSGLDDAMTPTGTLPPTKVGESSREGTDTAFSSFEKSLHEEIHEVIARHGEAGLWSIKKHIDHVLEFGPPKVRRRTGHGA